MTIYHALVHKDRRSDYGVSFPDFPGCVSAGATLEEAYRMAGEALAGHIAVMREAGDRLPEPSDLDIVRRSKDGRAAITTFAVSVENEESAVRVNITLPASLLQAVDVYAQRHGLTRSGLLARGAKIVMQGADSATRRVAIERQRRVGAR